MSVFQTIDSLREFFRGLVSVISTNDIGYTSVEESERSLELCGSKSACLFVDYLIRKRWFEIGIELLSSAAKQNVKFILPLNKLQSAMGDHISGIRLLAGYILSQPMSAQLLYHQAKNLFAVRKYEDAYKLANRVVSLVAGNFDAWMLLAKIFFKLENFEYTLVALNMAAERVRLTMLQDDFPGKSSKNCDLCEANNFKKAFTHPKELASIINFPAIFVINDVMPAVLKPKKA